MHQMNSDNNYHLYLLFMKFILSVLLYCEKTFFFQPIEVNICMLHNGNEIIPVENAFTGNLIVHIIHNDGNYDCLNE